MFSIVIFFNIIIIITIIYLARLLAQFWSPFAIKQKKIGLCDNDSCRCHLEAKNQHSHEKCYFYFSPQEQWLNSFFYHGNRQSCLHWPGAALTMLVVLGLLCCYGSQPQGRWEMDWITEKSEMLDWLFLVQYVSVFKEEMIYIITASCVNALIGIS